jgi:hypothetical protein
MTYGDLDYLYTTLKKAHDAIPPYRQGLRFEVLDAITIIIEHMKHINRYQISHQDILSGKYKPKH